MKHALQAVPLIFVSVLIISSCGGGSSSSEPVSQPPVVVVPDPVATTILKDGTEVPTAELVAIGDRLFNDTNLSDPVGQSCASCHTESAGFADPNQSNPSSIGADGISFGTRNSPTASYAAHIPPMQTVMRPRPPGNDPQPTLIGGLFIDGRVDDLEEQAKQPFLNPVEMANADEAAVIAKIRVAAYASDFESLFGINVLDDVSRSYAYVADAIAAFQRTDAFSPFTSKFDRVLAGEEEFTGQEALGQQIFNTRGQCFVCHAAQPGETEFFTDFQYHNIGVPSNPLLPAVMADPNFVDLGLGDFTGDPLDDGKFRTPTLRNIANTAPYMHNGAFNTLREVVEFYNIRDVSFGLPPEVDRNVDDRAIIGELNLNDTEIDALVAFMLTMSDQ